MAPGTSWLRSPKAHQPSPASSTMPKGGSARLSTCGFAAAPPAGRLTGLAEGSAVTPRAISLGG